MSGVSSRRDAAAARRATSPGDDFDAIVIDRREQAGSRGRLLPGTALARWSCRNRRGARQIPSFS
jgi:hypothetical protein